LASGVRQASDLAEARRVTQSFRRPTTPPQFSGLRWYDQVRNTHVKNATKFQLTTIDIAII
jgi:hypothetical protein